MEKTATGSHLTRVDMSGLFALREAARHIDLHANKARAVRGGDRFSPFKGRGIEYDQSRLYTPGDDIRNLDWQVTARTGKAHTKLFHEERERPVYVWLDYRRPMFFATRGRYKAVIASECAALLAWSAIAGGDRLGGVLFHERGQQEWKPKRGRVMVSHLIDKMIHHPAWNTPEEQSAEETEAGSSHAAERALRGLRRVARPGSLIFLLSDFRHFGEQARNHVLTMSRHNEIVLLLVYDPLERSLPDRGRYRLTDGQRERTLDVADSGLRRDHAQRFQTRVESTRRLANRATIRFLDCGTTQEPAEVLRAVLPK